MMECSRGCSRGSPRCETSTSELFGMLDPKSKKFGSVRFGCSFCGVVVSDILAALLFLALIIVLVFCFVALVLGTAPVLVSCPRCATVGVYRCVFLG